MGSDQEEKKKIFVLFKQKTAYGMRRILGGSEMCKRDRCQRYRRLTRQRGGVVEDAKVVEAIVVV